MNATEYEQRVQQMADALHVDCVLLANARYAVDPRPDPWQHDFHGPSRHYGQAHDLVRRVFGEPDLHPRFRPLRPVIEARKAAEAAGMATQDWLAVWQPKIG